MPNHKQKEKTDRRTHRQDKGYMNPIYRCGNTDAAKSCVLRAFSLRGSQKKTIPPHFDQSKITIHSFDIDIKNLVKIQVVQVSRKPGSVMTNHSHEHYLSLSPSLVNLNITQL